MNEDTLVSVHCYAGDAHQVIGNLPAYVHHDCPVVIMSPTDSPFQFKIDDPRVTTREAGLVGYIGQVSLDRQLAQMKALLQFPHKFFLMNDSDSVVLSPVIPRYLYEKDVVWSNQVFDMIPEHQGSFPHDWPHVAFQPPYFMSRAMLEKLVAAGESGHPFTAASPVMPFIDFYMVQLTMVAGVPWERIRDCMSCRIGMDETKHQTVADLADYNYGFNLVMNAVKKDGMAILHSIKNGTVTQALLTAHAAYAAGHRERAPRPTPAPRIGGWNRKQTPPQRA